MKTFPKWNPSWKYYFWTHRTSRKLLEERHPELLTFYDKTLVPVQKSDLMRYVVVYEFGGLYADLDTSCLRSLDIVTTKYACIVLPEPFEDGIIWENIPYRIPNGVFFCRAKHPFLEQVLRTISGIKTVEANPTLIGPLFFTSQYRRYSNISDKDVYRVNISGDTSSPYFYKGELPETHDDAIYIPNTRYFLDQPHPWHRDKIKRICENPSNATLIIKRMCYVYTRRGFDRKPSNFTFLEHAYTFSFNSAIDWSKRKYIPVKMIQSNVQTYKRSAGNVLEAVNFLLYSNSVTVGSLGKLQMSESSNVRVFDTSVDYSNAKQIFKCVDLRIEYLATTPICVYDPMTDIYVSKDIISKGSFEGDYIKEVVTILQDNLSLSFLDIGCNVGVFTLAVAKFGREVIALDANRKNLEMVATSLVKGNLTGKVKLIWNALSDRVEAVRFKHKEGNIGALQMESGINATNDSRDEESSMAIVLDDLVPLLRKQSVFVKMDIESYEYKAMSGGKKFFEEVDVRFLLMEWDFHRTSVEGSRIIQFMTERRFKPVLPLQRLVPLKVENRNAWPNEIMWIRI
ncbi:hypothetical protein DPMN_049574 [Dreissena polymorpha]|uniref:Methyltransferase FkbM domain-containing protein n=1 Tax=Dreissena polymorpha TaxID=45954 RepID=A0A9D4CEL1_DREPO|nr:hypothetical protein DPMN_049574 [Dreissena polymorpha]